MNTPLHDKRERRRALEEAGDWVQRLDDPAVTEAQLAAWRGWMQASRANAEAFHDIRLIWDSATHLSSDTVQQARVDVSKEQASGSKHSHRHSRSRTAGALRHHLRRLPIRWSMLGTVTVLIAVALWHFSGLPGGREHSPASRTWHYATSIGVRKQVDLPDGSTIELGANSRMTATYTSSGKRSVELLRGQAFFSVEHDPRRPFEVKAGGAVIRDLGTRFDIDYDQDEVSVTVAEGRVRLSPSTAEGDHAPSMVALDLPAGYQASLIPGQGLSEPRKVNVQQVLSWMNDVMIYQDAPLGRVIQDMNRYSKTPIRIDDTSLRRLPVTGRWSTRDVPGWIDGLAAALSLDVQYTPEAIVLSPEAGTGDKHRPYAKPAQPASDEPRAVPTID